MEKPVTKAMACALLFACFAPTPTFGGVAMLDPDIRELIVKFQRFGEGSPHPDEVLALVGAVGDHSAGAFTPQDWALYTRLGSPVDARWLIQLRLDSDYLDLLEKSDPDHPESHLQDYVVLRYSDAASRQMAYERLAKDSVVNSVVSNSKGTLSLRVNDYYVSATGPGQIPGGYQWALEAIGAMSPYSNPGAQSAWDKATGFGYVAIVDTGIMRIHPDLQANVKLHFS